MARRRLITENPEAAFRALRSQGVTLPRSAGRARVEAADMMRLPNQASLTEDVAGFWGTGTGTRETLSKYAGRKNGAIERRVEFNKMLSNFTQKEGAASNGKGGIPTSNVQYLWPKMRDPFEEADEKLRNLFLFHGKDKDKQRQRIQRWTRLLKATHSLFPSLVSIYSRFPLLEIELVHKDADIVRFNEALFLDQLDYQNYLFKIGEEHWTVGEAFPVGSWNENIGAWEHDDLFHPDDVVVTPNPALREFNYHLKVPQSIKKLIEEKQPKAEYEMLKKHFPDVINWAQKDQEIPMSDVLIKHIKFEVDHWNERGTPLILRALSKLMLEQNLEAAQEAVADRLVSPLLQVTLGLDDVDGEGTWIPEPEELDALNMDMMLAMMADFRAIVHHHGLEIKSVFGRELMPSLQQDFDYIDKCIAGIFGLSIDLIYGGSSAPYASTAVSREVSFQLMKSYQDQQKRFFTERMAAVAEAQGFYEYERKGDMLIPVEERVLLVNPETGEQEVKTQKKLAIPEPRMASMNLRDEATERQFLRELKEAGFPLSNQAMAVNIPYDFEEELERKEEEELQKTLAQLRFQQRLFRHIYYEELPVPEEIRSQFDQWRDREGLPDMLPEPSMDEAVQDVTEQLALPNIEDQKQLPPQEEKKPPLEQIVEETLKPEQRPEESDEQRKEMPKQFREKFRGGKKKIAEKLDKETLQKEAVRVKVGLARLDTPGQKKSKVMLRLPFGHTVFVEGDGDDNGVEEGST